MSRYVMLHKLVRGFKTWEYQPHNLPDLQRTVPYMTEEFYSWYDENKNLIKAVHQNKSYEFDRLEICLEFYNEEETLICMLRFA